MENKKEIYNLPLASFTFGRDVERIENNNNNYPNVNNNSNSLYMNTKQNSDKFNNNKMNHIQPYLSQDYFQSMKINNYNSSLPNNLSLSINSARITFNKIKKIIRFILLLI